MTQRTNPSQGSITIRNWILPAVFIVPLLLLYPNPPILAQSETTEKKSGKESSEESEPEKAPAQKEPVEKKPNEKTPPSDTQEDPATKPTETEKATKEDPEKKPESDAVEPSPKDQPPSDAKESPVATPTPTEPTKPTEEAATTTQPDTPKTKSAQPSSDQSEADKQTQIHREAGARVSVESLPTAPPMKRCANGLYAVENAKSQGPPVRLNGELGFLASSRGGESSVWVSPLLRGWFRILDMVAVSADWGFISYSGFHESDDRKSDFYIGNPFLGIHSVRQHGCTELRVGISATIPVGSLPSDTGTSTSELDDRNFAVNAYRGAMAMRGMWEWWQWVPDGMSIAIPVSWETASSEHWIGGGEVALASTVILKGGMINFMPIEDTQRAMLLIPLMGKVGYRLSPVIFGIRLHMVWFANVDELQVSTSPFVQLELPPGYVDIKFNLNLDKPFGFGAEEYLEGMLWGLHIGGGVGF